MASETVEVTGIVPSVEFMPNGSTEWKKQHTTKVEVKETGETITGMKYIWVKDDGVNEPATNLFTQDCLENRIITGGDETMTGTYYLWVLLTIGSGANQKTYICASNAFNFDNEAPTVQLTSTPISETSFTLTATVSDNNRSGIAKYEFYVDGKLVDTQETTAETATYTWTGTEMVKDKECYVIVYDRLKNFIKRDYKARTLLYSWKVYSTTSSKHYSYTGNGKNEAIGIFKGGDPWGYYGCPWIIYDKIKIKFDNTTGTFRESDPTGTCMFSDLPSAVLEYEGVLWTNCEVNSDNSQNVRDEANGSYRLIEVRGERLIMEQEITYSKGTDFIEDKYSKDLNQFPKDGEQNENWYVYQGIK